jgi:hypothetical protein
MMTLRNAIDKDFFYIENISYSDNDIKAMSFDELETLKILIVKKINGLSLSLKEKQEENYSSLETEARKNWSMSRKRALYINQQVLLYINSLTRKHRERKSTLADHFIEHAKAILPPMLFEEILHEAQQSAREGTHADS